MRAATKLSQDRNRRTDFAVVLLAVGTIAWTAVMVGRWPVGLSIGDEVGYVGQMRLVLQGHLHPLLSDAGVWVKTARGQVAKFPFFLPLLEAPLFALSPRLIFLPSLLAALALTLITARVLLSWGRSPTWGLVVLCYPTVVLLSRTTMADLILTAALVGAWWSLRCRRIAAAALLSAVAIAVKAIGLGLACLLLAGEALRDFDQLRGRDLRTWKRHLGAWVGVALGIGITAALNMAANGTPYSVYDAAHEYLHTPMFWPKYFRTSAPAHLSSLLLMPPLLIAGAWPLKRHREYGPLLLIGFLVSSMCFYFFVDRGRSLLDTLVLSPRLILPAVAFLLLGYASLLASLAERVVVRWRPLRISAALVPAAVAFVVTTVHERWLRVDAQGLAALSSVAQRRQPATVAVTWPTVKAAMLYRGRISMLDPLTEAQSVAESRPEVIFCSTRSPSYRDADTRYSCEFAGYREDAAAGDFHVLVAVPGASQPSRGTL